MFLIYSVYAFFALTILTALAFVVSVIVLLKLLYIDGQSYSKARIKFTAASFVIFFACLFINLALSFNLSRHAHLQSLPSEGGAYSVDLYHTKKIHEFTYRHRAHLIVRSTKDNEIVYEKQFQKYHVGFNPPALRIRWREGKRNVRLEMQSHESWVDLGELDIEVVEGSEKGTLEIAGS